MPMKVRKLIDLPADSPLDEMPVLKVASHKEFKVKPLINAWAEVKRRRSFMPPESTPPVGQWETTIALPDSPGTYVLAVELPKAPAEVVDIQTAKPYVGDTLCQDGSDDEAVALKAWLEAYSEFCHDISLHRIEKKLVVKPDGREYIKRIHVNKVHACWLLPGDHFGDPDGTRHQAAGGYPTRSLYIERARDSQEVRLKKATLEVHAVDVVRNQRAATGEKQHYDGPHWTGKMSKQMGVVGFFTNSRPPAFTEILSQHWADIARFHRVEEITTQKDYMLKSGKIETVIRTWKIRDASCWGHTPLGIQVPSQRGNIKPPTNEALELLSSQQTDLEAANNPDYAEYGTAMTDLEVKLEIGKEQVSGLINNIPCTLGFNTDKTEYALWLDDGTRFYPTSHVEQEENLVPPVLDDQVLLLPHLKTNYGFVLQVQLGERLLRDTMRRARVDWMIQENEELANRRVWRDISDTLFETLVPASYRLVDVIHSGKFFQDDHQTRAGEEKVWQKTVRIIGHGLPSYRNLGFQGYSNVYPNLSDEFYERWWFNAADETEEARLCEWFLNRDEVVPVCPLERMTFTRDGNVVGDYRLYGPRKPKQKIVINYVDRIEPKVKCEVVDLATIPTRFSKEAVDLQELIFRKDEVPYLSINEDDYGVDSITGLYLPRHLNSSPKDFKERILAPDRKKVGLLGRIRGLVSHGDDTRQ